MRIHVLTLILGFSACSEYDLTAKAEHGDGEVAHDIEPDISSPEPTVDTGPVGDCSDYSPSVVGAVSRDDSCQREATVGSFNPVIEWQWSANPTHPSYHQIMAAPAIANLNDDNGDGRVDEHDIPDVVFASFTGDAYTSPGAVTAIRGDTGETLWSVRSAGGHSFYSSSGIAIGDLEGDGAIEVCVSGTSAGVVCLNGVDGSLKWAAGPEIGTYGCPAIADLDGDGLAEVIFGRTIISSEGIVIANGEGGKGGPHRMSFAVDWDGDGTLEVIAGNTIYRADGSILWADAWEDEAPAVGDFNLDGRPDLVRAGGGQVRVTLNDGSLLWTVLILGGGSAGAPTVADFDGDGLPEVGVADLSMYTVYDTDGTVLWSNIVSDYSSSRTGSSVFDFEGDGIAEVVYADEHTLWIFDGETGEVRLEQNGHASGTLMEYPLIADVDNDGSTEIIVASNDYSFSGWTGITVIGDIDQSWAPARPIWNQYAYHITNVNNDGTIPTTQTQNWLNWNNFRTGGTELGPADWQPDLRPRPAEICTVTCDADEVTVYLPIVNRGLIEATNVVVVIERSDGTQIDVKNVGTVADGDGMILGPIVITASQWGSERLFSILDWPDNIDECLEENNIQDLGVWPCASLD